MIQRTKRWALPVLFALLVFFAPQWVAAQQAILTAGELAPGMRGVAKTVIEGTKIDLFSVDIVGVLQEGKETDGQIIARVSGDVIDKTGGVLQGMSGSPVYIDDKLVGAISGTWKDIDNRMCIITPIADMMKLWDMPDTKKDRNKEKIPLKKELAQTKAIPEHVEDEADLPIVEAAETKDAEIKDTEANDEQPVSDAKPLATPLMVSGFGPAGLEMLAEHLKPLHMVPYSTGGAGGGPSAPVKIEPGSSIGAQVVRGDISVAAIGTVTAVEDGKVLAFGHPFLRKGNVNLFMTDAEILSSAIGINSGFKVGTAGNLVGRINQDRSAAIGGVLGEYPRVVPLRINVEDAQLGVKKSYGMQIAYDEELLTALVGSLVYNAIDQTIDRLGQGTAKVGFEIMTDATPEGVVKRDNMYYNAADVGQIAVGEILSAMNLLCTNAQGEVDIGAIKVDIKMDANRKTASILEAIPDKPQVKPGETVNFKVKLKPYRGKEETIVVPYAVPKHQPSGPMPLELRGGGLVSLVQMVMQQQGIDLSVEEDKSKPLGVMIKEFLDMNKNNEIVIAPAALPLDEQAAQEKNAAAKNNAAKSQPKSASQGAEKKKAAQSESPIKKHPTAYIIDNLVRTAIQVE